MSKIITYIIITMLTLGLTISEAGAKRFGAGRSFGIQRSTSSLFAPRASHAKQAFTQTNNTRKWGGILGGLLIGGLLTSLFMGHGLGSGLFSWLIVGLVAYAAFIMLRRKMHPAFQAANSSRFQNQFQQEPLGMHTATNNRSDTSYPRDFIPESFLREAKISFIRLQKAYDQKNTQDLTAFTAPEVFAEIKLQLDEEPQDLNHTEVIHLEAKLLDIQPQDLGMLASVHFTGQIQENANPATALNEIWHFRQFHPGGDWVVGGIQ